MDIILIERETGLEVEASIDEVERKHLPLKKDGWNFNWRSLYKTEGARFYNLSLKNEVTAQGMLMLSVMYEDMLFANNIEVSPENYGSKGKYLNVAGCLIAYGCLKSFELGRNEYAGFLTFESKTALIDLYHTRYGATHAMGQKMYIEPNQGLHLIEKYLNLKL